MVSFSNTTLTFIFLSLLLPDLADGLTLTMTTKHSTHNSWNQSGRFILNCGNDKRSLALVRGEVCLPDEVCL